MFSFKSSKNAKLGPIAIYSKSAVALNNVTFSGDSSQIHVSVLDTPVQESKVYVSQPEVQIVDVKGGPWPLQSSFGNARAEDKTLLLEDDPWLKSMHEVHIWFLWFTYSCVHLWPAAPQCLSDKPEVKSRG